MAVLSLLLGTAIVTYGALPAVSSHFLAHEDTRLGVTVGAVLVMAGALYLRRRGDEMPDAPRNLEAGFRRLTMLVSLLLLLLGTSTFTLKHWQAWEAWRQAGEPEPPGFRMGYVVTAGESVGYFVVPPPPLRRPGSSEAEPVDWAESTKADLDNPAARSLVAYPRADDARRTFKQVTMAFIYHEAHGVKPSRLYTRRELLQAEAKGTLAPEIRLALFNIRQQTNFPQPIPTFPADSQWTIVVGSILGTAAPWFVFLVVRWIIRGFVQR